MVETGAARTRRKRVAGLVGSRRHALREDAARAGRIPARELPHDEVDAHPAYSPGKVGQVARVTAMHRGRWYGTTWAACMRRRRRQLESHGVLFHGDLVQVHVGS